MVRVVHLYRRFWPDYTGDGIYFLRMIDVLKAFGTQHEILCAETASEQSTSLVDGVSVHYLRHPQAGSRSSLHRWILEHRDRFDVLHIHSHVDWRLTAYGLARLLGKRLVFSCTLDDSPTDLLRRYRTWSRPFARLFLAGVERFITISPRLYLDSLRTVEEQRLRLIPQGVVPCSEPDAPEHGRERARERLGVDPRDVLWLHVGSVCRRKNQEFLIRRLARVDDPRVRLDIVGPVLEPDYAQQLRHLVAELGLQDRVRFHGFIDRPDDHYRAADIFVFASRSEGFGNVFLEAMSHGLAVVTLHLRGITDHVFEHGVTGVVCTNESAFDEAVRQLVEDPVRRRRIGEAAAREVRHRYDLRRFAQDYAGIYRGEPQDQTASPTVSDCRMTGRLRQGSPDLPWADLQSGHPPILMVVIDTESEFDWQLGVGDDSGRVSAIAHLQPFVHSLLDEGARPCLVVDHPVAADPSSSRVIRHCAAVGAEIGVHLQPWTAPPHCTPADAFHSHVGNLGVRLQAQKLRLLRRRLEELIGDPCRTFKAGRYGVSPQTLDLLFREGFEVDLSASPGFDCSGDGGVDWRGWTSQPVWWRQRGGLLMLPTTGGLVGHAADALARCAAPAAAQVMLERLHLGHPCRLSPEGNDLRTMLRLTRNLRRQGLGVYTLSLHSPSLAGGFTPYCRTARQAADLQAAALAYVRHFRRTLGGVVMTPAEVRRLFS